MMGTCPGEPSPVKVVRLVHMRIPVVLFGAGVILCTGSAGGQLNDLAAGGPAAPITPTALDVAFARAADLAPLTSLLVAHRGRLVREEYYRGLRPDRRVNVKSVSKSVISALVGIAIQQGHLRTAEQRLWEFYPERFAAESDVRWFRISLHDLLSMRTGLETASFHNYGPWVTSRNWVNWVLQRPFECMPSSCWSYSTGSSHVLSAILTKVTGQSTLAFARAQLFAPIGVSLSAWERDPQGIYMGGNNMLFTPRELLAFGLLYANGGRHGERQIIPAEWIELSWRRLGRSPWNGHSYGYGWWTRTLAGYDVHFAWGYGGQYVFVVPELELVAVVTSSLTNRPPGSRRHNWRVLRLVRDYVIPAVATGR